MSTLTNNLIRWPKRQPLVFLLIAAALWWGLYQLLIPFSEAIVAALPVDRASHLGSALQFFFYDTPKVLLLLTGVVFVMGMVNSYFTPERTRALLAGRTVTTFALLGLLALCVVGAALIYFLSLTVAGLKLRQFVRK